MLRCLAAADSAAATARTWLTPPALPSTSAAGDGLHGVDDQQPGLHLVDLAEHRRQVVLGGQVDVRVQRAHPVGAETHLGRDSSPLTISTGPCPRAAHALAADSSSVDLPTPGSPASSTTAPGVRPPPSTRSSSATPLACGLDQVGRHLVDPQRPAVVTGPAVTRRSVTSAGPASISVPHAWHSGHRPCHLAGRCPHSPHW